MRFRILIANDEDRVWRAMRQTTEIKEIERELPSYPVVDVDGWMSEIGPRVPGWRVVLAQRIT